MSLWSDLQITEENGKELKIEDFSEPTQKDFIDLYCRIDFGGVCNEKELKKISKIVYKAYLRKWVKKNVD